jgi:hypothetical protein
MKAARTILGTGNTTGVPRGLGSGLWKIAGREYGNGPPMTIGRTGGPWGIAERTVADIQATYVDITAGDLGDTYSSSRGSPHRSARMAA